MKQINYKVIKWNRYKITVAYNSDSRNLLEPSRETKAPEPNQPLSSVFRAAPLALTSV